MKKNRSALKGQVYRENRSAWRRTGLQEEQVWHGEEHVCMENKSAFKGQVYMYRSAQKRTGLHVKGQVCIERTGLHVEEQVYK